MTHCSDGLIRSDYTIGGDSGYAIAIRSVQAIDGAGALPLLLVHGGGGGGVPSFDNPAPGASVSADLTRAGHPVYLIDIRGWGGSSRPPTFDQPPEANPPAVTSAEAVVDIAAAVEEICEREQVAAIGLLGWASGGHWAGMYAASAPERVAKLLLLNSIYSVDAPWSMRGAFEDPGHPGEFDRRIGAYSLRSAQSLLGAWERSIPLDDKDDWRDPLAAQNYAELTVASDPTSGRRTPPSLRTPTGFQKDAYALARGERFWNANAITGDVLIIRGSRDFWSRPEDVTALAADLTNANSVRSVEIPDGTHFLFLDLPERGRQRFIEEAVGFFESP